jgi:pimeloyl-ACP methyl ester carboxylesterase
MDRRTIETRKGIQSEVLEAGDGAPLVFFHGAGGLLPQEPLLEQLAQRYHVYAPVWPGYGPEPTEDLIEDMLDFTLHGWDIVDALGLERPHLVGHSMGGMIAAEMAAINPKGLDKLALIAPAGLWLDQYPIPDIFATTPFDLPKLLFADPSKGEVFLTGGTDFSNRDALRDFMVGNARRLGTAGKILFPVPNRRLSKRLYRLTAPALVVWGREDQLIPPVYADRWLALVPQAEKVVVADAGHMVPYEQPEAVEQAIVRFLG